MQFTILPKPTLPKGNTSFYQKESPGRSYQQQQQPNIPLPIVNFYLKRIEINL